MRLKRSGIGQGTVTIATGRERAEASEGRPAGGVRLFTAEWTTGAGSTRGSGRGYSTRSLRRSLWGGASGCRRRRESAGARRRHLVCERGWAGQRVHLPAALFFEVGGWCCDLRRRPRAACWEPIEDKDSRTEQPATVLNFLMEITRAAGRLGIPGVYVTARPGRQRPQREDRDPRHTDWAGPRATSSASARRPS